MSLLDSFREHFKDVGFRSRKFVLTVATMLLIFAGGVMAGVWSLFGSHYETMISGLLGALGLYLGGNVGSRWATTKHAAAIVNGMKDKDAPEASPEEDPDPPSKRGAR